MTQVATVADLPERYQKQAERKLEAQRRGRPSGRELAKTLKDEKPKQSKYKNRKAEYNGITFDSQKEMRRYVELLGMCEAGLITDLHLQQDFTLQERYLDADGNKVDAIKYRADFTYYDSVGNWVIEDVKGMKTDVYKLKKKLMAGKGYRIQEV